MNAETYYGLYKIAADEESWWDKNQHKVWQAALPGLGTYAISRLFGVDPAISAALGLGAGAVGWHSGDWAKDWFKKDKPKTGGDQNYVMDETDDPGYETQAQEQEKQVSQWVKDRFGVPSKLPPRYDPIKAADPTGKYGKQYAMFQQALRESNADREKRDQEEAAKQMQQHIADHDYQQQMRAEEAAKQMPVYDPDAEHSGGRSSIYDELAYGAAPTEPATTAAEQSRRHGGTSASLPVADQVRLIASLVMTKYKLSAADAWEYARGVVAKGRGAVKAVVDNISSKIPNTPPARPFNKNSKFFNFTR